MVLLENGWSRSAFLARAIADTRTLEAAHARSVRDAALARSLSWREYQQH